jgi:hypothetical protein
MRSGNSSKVNKPSKLELSSTSCPTLSPEAKKYLSMKAIFETSIVQEVLYRIRSNHTDYYTNLMFIN